MKNYFIPFLFLCLFAHNTVFSNPFPAPIPIVNDERYTPMLASTHPFDVNSDFINSEALTAKLVEGLSKIYKSKKLSFEGLTAQTEGNEIILSGKASMYKIPVGVTAKFSKDEKLISFEGNFNKQTLKNSSFKKLSTNEPLSKWFPSKVAQSITLDQMLIEFQPGSLTPSNLSMSVLLNKGWKVLDAGMLTINDLKGTFAIENPTSSKTISTDLSGGFDVGPTTIEIATGISSANSTWTLTGGVKSLSFTDLVGAVIGQTEISGISMPQNMFDVAINDASFTISPTQKSFVMNGNTTLGQLELNIAPKETRSKQLEFIAGFSPAETFKLASLEPSLSIVDELGITNFGIVLSSAASTKTNLKVFEKIGGSTDISRGLNYVAAYDLRPVKMDEMLGLETIMLKTVISNRPADLMLEASLNTHIPVGDVAVFKKIAFRLKPSPGNFEISMLGEMSVQVDKDILIFSAEAGVDVTNQSIFFVGQMKNMWNNPLGAQGMAIGDLGMKIEVSFTTTPIPLPAIGLKGKLVVGDFNGDLTMFLNTRNPSECMLDAGFNKISLKDILETYCSAQVMGNIPDDVKNTVLNVSMEDARLTVVPRPMKVFDESYDAGFRVAGKASIADYYTLLDVSVNYNTGIRAKAEMSAINYEPYFALTGARGNPNPMLEIVLEPSPKSKVAVSGAATLLGITAEADMHIKDTGFDMYMRGKVFDKFDAKINVTGSSIEDGGSFYVSAEMEQNLMEYITKHASEEIDKATKATQDDITAAQNTITREQKKLDGLTNDINAMRRTVQAERDRDIANIRAAQNEVAKARAEVNKIQADIDRAYAKIKAVEKEIQAKERWVNAEGDFVAIGRGLEAAPFFVEKGAIITGLYAEIGTYETGRGIAQGVLIATEESAKLVGDIGELVPVDADPRLVGLFTARDGSKAILEGAKQVLEGGKIIGVGTLDAAKWIVENGPHQVVDITYAKFEGKLSVADGGTVSMQVKGTLADEPFEESFSFSFDNPIPDIIEFADDLIK